MTDPFAKGTEKDKWPGQDRTSPIGFPRPGFNADNSDKRASLPKEAIPCPPELKERVQKFVQTLRDKGYSVLMVDQLNYIDLYVSFVPEAWQHIPTGHQEDMETHKSFVVPTMQAMLPEAAWEYHRIPYLPEENARVQLKIRVYKKDTRNTRKAASMSPTFDGGYFDSPGKGLGQADTGDAIFPSNSWLPKGTTDKSTSEDIQLGNSSSTKPSTSSVEEQIEKALGKEYREAFDRLKQAVQEHESPEESISIIVNNSDYVLDTKILNQLAEKYLR